MAASTTSKCFVSQRKLHSSFLAGVPNVVSVMSTDLLPDCWTSTPFYQQSQIHVDLVLSLETDYAFPLAEKVEAFSAGPSAFVAAAPVAATITVTPAAGAVVPAKCETKEESEQSVEGVGFSLFD